MSGTDNTGSAGATPGLRERRRLETAAEITEAALSLFEELGFAQTTIADIAERAGVSPRTFFRYFPSKEAVVLTGQQHFGRAVAGMLEELEPGRPALDQLRRVFRNAITTIDDGNLTGLRHDILRARRLIAESTELRAAALRADEENALELARFIAERSQPRGGMREARLIVEAATFVLQLAFEEWVDGGAEGGSRSLASLYDELVDTQHRLHTEA